MRKQISMLRMIFLIAALAALVACGKGNSDAPLVDSNGKHPANWIGQHGVVAASSASTCTECHGENLTGGIARVGCFSTPQTSFNGFVCHATNPTVNKGCDSCHGTPPNGITAPNRANAHPTHMGLAGVTCGTCHNGAGSGTANHMKATATGGIAGATVSFPDTLKANTITTTFAYDAASGTCSGIICHGGLTTPSWSTGSINAATDCLKCHGQGTAFRTPQFNSFYSGIFPFPTGVVVNLHQFHLISKDPTSTAGALVICTSCHNTDTLATLHFAGLTTSSFEVLPGDTLGGGSTNITSYTPYTSGVPSGHCLNSCHAIRYWIN